MEKNHKNAEVRYTAGTRHDRRLWQNGTEHENTIGVQEEIDRVRDAHRRTALALVCKLLRDDLSLTRGLLLLRLRTETPNSEWFEYETNVHGATGVIVDHALRITAEHGFAPSTLLDLAISFADFSRTAHQVASSQNPVILDLEGHFTAMHTANLAIRPADLFEAIERGIVSCEFLGHAY